MTEWAWWEPGREAVRVISRRDLWGTHVAEILSDATEHLRHVPAAELRPIGTRQWSASEIAWRASAARAVSLVAAGEPIATRSATVQLLPHQLSTLERAIGMQPVRLAICDEVGLGKTITAAAIFAEMKGRGQITRALVVAPKGVQLQWVAEFYDRFGEEFVRVGPEGLPVDSGVDPWRSFNQVVCSLDAVKPVRARAGWDPATVDAYNQKRFRAVVEAGWDLVIIDEAHHVAGSSEEVARHRLARELASVAQHCLLLSGTPHSGKTEGFRRFLSLLDKTFLQGKPLNPSTVSPYIARAEKRTATDGSGRPLFAPRTTRMEVVPYGDRKLEQILYEAVTEFVREGYGRALRERRPIVGFLVLLMQRLLSSSTAAIRTALERRMAALEEGAQQLRLLSDRHEDWEELTGEEQMDAIGVLRGAAWTTERQEVEHLLGLARRAESSGPDSKALFFLTLLHQLQREDGNPRVKVLVFTEFLPTQDMILALLTNVGIEAVAINGSMGLGERAIAQDAFRGSAQVLVSTDAGGEGINLQFAHVVVNWDLPWSPSKLEQRIGRVDRIGQQHPVRAFNLVMENSIDARVLEVLEEKLATILLEFGADKRSDILETASARAESIYVGAIAGEEWLSTAAADFYSETRADLAAQAEVRDLLHVDPVRPKTAGLRLRTALSDMSSAREELGLDAHEPVALLRQMPGVGEGEPVPVIAGPEQGTWACWEVRADSADASRTTFAAFIDDRGLMRPHLTEQLWNQLARGVKVTTGPCLPSEAWEQLTRFGVDYAYRSASDMAGGSPPSNPSVRVLLVVRVKP